MTDAIAQSKRRIVELARHLKTYSQAILSLPKSDLLPCKKWFSEEIEKPYPFLRDSEKEIVSSSTPITFFVSKKCPEYIIEQIKIYQKELAQERNCIFNYTFSLISLKVAENKLAISKVPSTTSI